jgi:hypothetical protein
MHCNKKSLHGAGIKPLACFALALGMVAAWAESPGWVSPQRDQQAGLDFFREYEVRPSVAPYLLADKSAAVGNSNRRDALFGDDDEDTVEVSVKPETKAFASSSGVKGFLQVEMARAVEAPVHWSKMLTRADISSQGNLGDGIKWKMGARMDYDAVYSFYDTYPSEVARDQRSNLILRENYLDIGAGEWDFRLGRQHVVWGEMVGLFFADVVSARDMREFILPEFDTMRIPQWAARAEYFKDDFHAELLWIPVASYDEIGKPGAEFFPYPPPAPPGVAMQFRNEVRPSRTLSNGNYGLRLSTLRDGWDVSGFFYSSMDVAPTFYREIITLPQPTMIYEARHDRINQFGGTVAKDFGQLVLKGEAVYTQGRSFSVLRATDADGVVPQNTLDWALGLDFSLPADTRLNLQVFQRDFFSHDPDIVPGEHETGYSVLVNHKLSDKLEAQALWIASINRTDWMFRPRVTWNFERNWRLAVGADVFKGPSLGLFGQYAGRDRVYSEIRYSF